MALLLLTSVWARATNSIIVALTVNHNLRAEAASEAKQVAKWCAARNIEHHTLNWLHEQPPTTAIQSSAREARYLLMSNWCKDKAIKYLLTAHHQGDQAETLFFRLARGSGLLGLAAILPVSNKNGITLLRPLLTTSKTRLIATLQQHGQEWIEDPSNQNPQYTRVAIRKQLENIIASDSDFLERITTLTRKLQHFRAGVENYIKNELAENAIISPLGYAVINLKNPISAEAFSYLLQIISGNEYPPRSEKLARFYTQIYENKNTNSPLKKRSFFGLIFELAADNSLLIYREEKAIQPAISIAAGNSVMWDKRFLLASNTQLTARALGTDGIKLINSQAAHLLNQLIKSGIKKSVLKTLPSFWHLEELVTVPHIGYMTTNPDFSNTKTSANFSPSKIENHLLEKLFAL